MTEEELRELVRRVKRELECACLPPTVKGYDKLTRAKKSLNGVTAVIVRRVDLLSNEDYDRFILALGD